MYQLGIDIGSTTIKAALIKVQRDDVQCTKEVRILATDYRRHNAEPMKVGQEMIEGILQRSGLTASKANGLIATWSNSPQDGLTIAITGSVGMGYATRLGVPFVQEVIAAAEVVKQMYPEVHTLVDIGGEDKRAPREGAKPHKSSVPWTTKPFEVEDKERVILAPYFAEGYNEFLPTIFKLAGYKMVPLPMGTQADAEEGLRVANNDICYPATIVVGSILLLRHYAHVYDKICRPFPYYRPFSDIMDVWRASRKVINSAADFGEGWFLPGEICELAESGVKKVVSLQPFGCIANHIISKGIERRYKDLYPDLSLLFLDFDAGTSEANVANRLHFMLEN